MTTSIKQADLIETIAGALQYISYYHPADYIAHLARAYEAEKSPAAKDAIAQILTNSRMSATGHRPICQDTGTRLPSSTKIPNAKAISVAVGIAQPRIAVASPQLMAL